MMLFTVGGSATWDGGGAGSPFIERSGESSRAFSLGRRPKIRRRGKQGGALGMGKGLDRKKAKKEQVCSSCFVLDFEVLVLAANSSGGIMRNSD